MGKVKFKTIVKIADKIKNHVEKEHILPGSVVVDNVTYTYPVASYLMATSVNNLGKDITLVKVKKAPTPKGESVNLRLTEKEYKGRAKILSDFIKKNGRLPNYLKIKNKKVKQRVFIYSFAKIIVFYNAKKVLPSYCDFKTSETVKKSTTAKNTSKTSNGLHDYLQSIGCSGWGQCTGYYCACNSLQQSFYRLTGIKVDEGTIAKWAGTTSLGTDHQGISTAVAMFNKKYGKKVKLNWYNFSDLGKNDTERWRNMQNYINKGALFCHLLYRDQYGHYEVPKSVGGTNLNIINSLGNNCGGSSYCGYIETRSKSTQKRYIQGISQKSIAVLTI